MKTGLLLAVALYAAGEIAQPLAPEIAPWAQLGAVGVLGWVATVLVGELRAARSDNAKQREEHAAALENLMTRWDTWEQTRHDDALAMQETLRHMVATCTAARAQTGEAVQLRN
jgi:hypothetical protein